MTALVLLAAVIGGSLATYLYDDESPLFARIAAGPALGLLLLGLSGFVIASFVGLSGATVVLAVLATLIPAALVLARDRARVAADARVAVDLVAARLLHPDRWSAALAVIGAGAAWLLWRVFDRAMYVSPDGGIATGVDHNLGDLPFHLAVITSFLYGDNFPPEHPELAGVRLTYPFLVDFVTALLMRAGASLRFALLAVNVLLGWSFAALLFRWAAHVTRDRLAAVATPLIVFFSGGLGFRLLAKDVDPSTGLLHLLPRLTHDYTILAGGGLRWGNLVITMLMPQRSILFGLPLVIAVWTLWWQALREHADARTERRMMLGAGAITGLLPLVHSHAFAVTLAVAAALALLTRRLRGWAAYFAAAAVLAVPQLLWFLNDSGLQAGKFLAWHLGWDRGARRLGAFWLDNLGLFLPLVVVALAWGIAGRWLPHRVALFYAPFVFCFLVPNVLQLSPWIWDNIKFLVWWHIASAPLVALLLARIWRGGGWLRTAAAGLFAVLVLSGALDVGRVASRTIDHRLYDGGAAAFGQRIRAVTPPGSIVLHAPTYNSEVYLAGRRSVIGYPGHTWSQGLDGGTREDDVRAIYTGAENADALLARHRVDYVLVGPRELEIRGASDAHFERFRLVAEAGRHRLYAVR